MDFYNFILSKGGQVIQDGSAWRALASKDGSKIIHQFADKAGNVAVDTYEAGTNKVLKSSRKIIKNDTSYISRVIDYIQGKNQLFAVQKLGDKETGSFMSALFKWPATQKAPSRGEFCHVLDSQMQKRGEVTYIPINKSIMPKDSKLMTRVGIFNSKFGKIE